MMHRIGFLLHMLFLSHNFTLVLNVGALQRCNSKDKDTPQAYCVKPRLSFFSIFSLFEVFLGGPPGMKFQNLQGPPGVKFQTLHLEYMLRGLMIKTFHCFLLLT